MKPTHLMRALRDFARTGRASKETLNDFRHRGLVGIDRYGCPYLTSHGVDTLHNLDKGTGHER